MKKYHAEFIGNGYDVCTDFHAPSASFSLVIPVK
jgi:hypothetical protein